MFILKSIKSAGRQYSFSLYKISELLLFLLTKNQLYDLLYIIYSILYNKIPIEGAKKDYRPVRK